MRHDADEPDPRTLVCSDSNCPSGGVNRGNIIRHGRRNGRQRFKCRLCRTVFFADLPPLFDGVRARTAAILADLVRDWCDGLTHRALRAKYRVGTQTVSRLVKRAKDYPEQFAQALRAHDIPEHEMQQYQAVLRGERPRLAHPDQTNAAQLRLPGL